MDENRKSKLEQHTQNYWNLSSSYNGRSQKKITVSKANKMLGEIFRGVHPKRRLYNIAALLSAEIIQGSEVYDSGSTNSSPNPNNP